MSSIPNDHTSDLIVNLPYSAASGAVHLIGNLAPTTEHWIYGSDLEMWPTCELGNVPREIADLTLLNTCIRKQTLVDKIQLSHKLYVLYGHVI